VQQVTKIYNEIYLLIKYVKSFLWRGLECLSYIEDAWCLKVNSLMFRFAKGKFYDTL